MLFWTATPVKVDDGQDGDNIESLPLTCKISATNEEPGGAVG